MELWVSWFFSRGKEHTWRIGRVGWIFSYYQMNGGIAPFSQRIQPTV
jgi:hypothetical protein